MGEFGDRAALRLAMTMHRATLSVTVFGHRNLVCVRSREHATEGIESRAEPNALKRTLIDCIRQLFRPNAPGASFLLTRPPYAAALVHAV